MAKPKKPAAWAEPVELLKVRGGDADGVEVARWSDDMGTQELRQHAPVVETAIYEQSPLTGRNEKRKVRRTLDVLDRLLKASQIEAHEFDAGRRFQTEFDIARLDPTRAADLARIPGGGGAVDAGRITAAKDAVWRMMTSLGGHGAPIAEAAWWVLGARLTVQSFAQRQRWGAGKGDHMNPMTAAGLVIGALNVLGGERKRRA